LPDRNGIDLLRQWRSGGLNEAVLILSARDTVQDRIRGLNHGADDYLPKPFSLEELVARLRSLMRRQTGSKKTVFEHRGLTFQHEMDTNLLDLCMSRLRT
jgi:DNA-binding response OmpR family regulator